MVKVIEPTFAFESPIGEDLLLSIERAARTCYKSEDKIAPGSASKLVRMLIERGHEAMLEHSSLSIRFICDRGVSHELVRHRLAAFAQESTRYCNYSKDKFGEEITVIKPPFWPVSSLQYEFWLNAMKNCERAYMNLIASGATAQEARSVLPNSLKTEIVVTANLREWRHILRLRTSSAAHPQMRQLMVPLLGLLRTSVPVIFEDVECPSL